MAGRILVLDFDGTITTTDTTGVIGQTVYQLKKLALPWNHYTSIYEKHYISRPENFNPDAWGVVCDYERRIRTCELSSIDELEAQEHFKDVKIHDLVELASQEVRVRAGLPQLMDRFDITYILSINWSRDLIHEVTGISKNNIFCNDLLSRDGIHYSGGFSKSIVCGWDKYLKLQQLKEEGSVTYIGDSFGDLPCVLDNDVNGYIIGEKLRSLPVEMQFIESFDEVC